MIVRSLISHNIVFFDHIKLFRNLLRFQFRSYYRIFTNLFISTFYSMYNNKMEYYRNDFKYISNNNIRKSCKVIYYRSLYIISLIYNDKIFYIRKKVNLFMVPYINYNASFTINFINRTIISRLDKNFDFIYHKSFGEISVSIMLLSEIVVKLIILNKKMIYVEVMKCRFKLFEFLSLLGVTILKLICYYSNIINVIFCNAICYIECVLDKYINTYLPFTVYDSKLMVCYNKGDYLCSYDKSICYYYEYMDIRSCVNKIFIIYRSVKYNKIFFRRNTRLNINKVLLISYNNILFFSVYYIDSIYIKYIDNFFSVDDIVVNSTIVNKFLECFGLFGDDYYKESNYYKYTFGNRYVHGIFDCTRKKINKFINNNNDSKLLLSIDDFLGIIKGLIDRIDYSGDVNVIDDLDNKKIYSIGDFFMDILKKYFRKCGSFSKNKFYDSVCFSNNITIFNQFREFLCISSLSQFSDQVNHLSEVTHKRRVTHLGNLDSDKIYSSSIREINLSYFGRICPIETPEGKNIGIINSLSSMVVIENNRLLSQVLFIGMGNNVLNFNKFYLKCISFDDELCITIFDSVLLNTYNKKYSFMGYNLCRYNKFVRYKHIFNMYYIYINSIQIFSVAPLMIPFMDHNDGNRILMGANMQRQAIPCIKISVPYVSTGIEILFGINLNYCFLIDIYYRLIYYDCLVIIYLITIKNIFYIKCFYLKKFLITNQCMFLNQRPNNANMRYDFVSKLVNDTNCTIDGYLCLGQNLLSVFLPWRGYNFEDAIVISQAVANSDRFCSLHVYTYNIDIADNFDCINSWLYNNDCNYKIHNNYDQDGVIKVGSYVSQGDVLIYKYVCLRKYNKSIDYDFLDMKLLIKDNFIYERDYFRVPEGIYGKVIGVNKCCSLLNNNVYCYDYSKYKLLINKILLKKFYLFVKHKYISYYGDGSRVGFGVIFLLINCIKILYYRYIIILNRLLVSKYKYKLLNKVRNKINITIVTKKYLNVGDKLSGRYGNKGVVSKVLAVEDMPYLLDGTPCEIILNPMGIPSRMNVGQLFELKLGLIIFIIFRNVDNIYLHYGKFSLKYFLKQFDIFVDINNIGKYGLNIRNNITFSTIPFDGIVGNDLVILARKTVSYSDKNRYVLNDRCEKLVIYDGVSGVQYGNKISFGYLYYLKLYHLSVDKLHARSIGPYSLITQQPLKGKNMLGGQRFGEMEVWALEAYGAAYLLHEILMIKSDDVYNRKLLFKYIMFNKAYFKHVIPEAFKVLILELKALCINVSIV